MGEYRGNSGEYSGSSAEYSGNSGEYPGSIAMNMNKRDPGHHYPEYLMEKLDLVTETELLALQICDGSAEKRWPAISFKTIHTFSQDCKDSCSTLTPTQ